MGIAQRGGAPIPKSVCTLTRHADNSKSAYPWLSRMRDATLRLLGDWNTIARADQVGMRFLPNSHASMDQAPGPIIASVPLKTARRIGTQGSPSMAKAIHS